jgi:hypothetical protein
MLKNSYLNNEIAELPVLKAYSSAHNAAFVMKKQDADILH